MSTQSDEVIRLKAEIFDLQVQYGKIRQLMEEKIKKLNELLKEQKGE